MFGNLKEKALESFSNQVVNEIQSKAELFSQLKPSQVKDDPIYQQLIVNPLWTLMKAQSGGTMSALQKFVDVEGKFSKALFHLRNELLQIDGERVSLHPDFQSKAGPVLLTAMKQ